MASAVTDKTRVAIVCTPNNPTGTTVSQADFEDFMGKVRDDLLVILDEAYVEFVTDPGAVNGKSLLGKYPNLVILRTFSKAFGLAGLRVGYAIGPEKILDAARVSAIPLSVTEAAQAGAMAALDHEVELLDRVKILVERRERILDAVGGLAFDIPRSQANFIWIPSGAHTEEANEVLLSHGLVGRVLAPDGIRVSIGEEESVSALIDAVKEIASRYA